jgi:cell division inhibitor SepF
MMGAVNSVMTFFGFGSAEPQKVEASAKPRPAAARPRRGSEMSEIITLEPQTYADGKEVAAHYRQGVPVIVNIGGMSEADAKRMLDFMLGLKEALEGQIRRVTPKVFLLSPSHVEVNDGEPEATDADPLLD